MAALDDLTTAQAAAAEAARKAAEAQVATTAASRAVDDARARLDVFATAVYQEGLDTGPFGLLTGAQDPDDLVGRAEFTDIVARSAHRPRWAGAGPGGPGERRLAGPRGSRRGAGPAGCRRGREAELRRGAGRGGRRRAGKRPPARRRRRPARRRCRPSSTRPWPRMRTCGRSASGSWPGSSRWPPSRRPRRRRPGAGRATGSAAPAGARGSVRQAIDRALAQVGTRYVWGGGSGRGPTTGIEGGSRGTGVRLLRADALRVQRRRGLPASGEPQPVQCRPEGADLRPPAR